MTARSLIPRLTDIVEAIERVRGVLGDTALEGFEADWQQQHDALAILRPQDYQQLESLGTPMRVIYTAPSYVAVVRE